jgi:hypothetical protein
MIPVLALVPVDGEISARGMSTLDPDLPQVRIAALSLALGIRDDHLDPGQQLAALHQAETVRAAPLHQADPVVAESSEIDVDRGGFGTGRPLQADRHVDSTPERGGDGAGAQAQGAEQFGEARRQVDSRTLFGHDDASSDAGQVDASGFQLVDGGAETFGAQFHHAVRAEGVADFVLAHGGQPEGGVHFHLRRGNQDGMVAGVYAAQAPGRGRRGNG